MAVFNLKVKGMHCKSCEMLITDSLEEAGARNIKVSHKTGLLSLESDLPFGRIKELVIKEGYGVE
jgi:copper chaperone CopZ